MSAPAVQLDAVSVAFGDYQALDNISLAVQAGSFTAIIGPNGCGKTTLLHTILGIQATDAGSVSLFGAPTNDVDPSDLGYVPQVKTLDRSFPAKALELVVTGITRTWPWRIRAAHREQALAAMTDCGVAQLSGRSVASLSGGELQRVYLARSLVRKPRLILLDEPAAGMDLAAEAAMYHHLLDYQRASNATVLMVTHDWEGAREHASHVLLLNRAVVDYGLPAKVATNERLLSLFGHTGHVHHTHEAPVDA